MYFYPLLLSLVAGSVLPERQLNSDALQNKVAKFNAVKTPSYVPDPFDYVSTMIKYDIQPTLPGALSYNEIISASPGLMRRSVHRCSRHSRPSLRWLPIPRNHRRRRRCQNVFRLVRHRKFGFLGLLDSDGSRGPGDSE